MRAVIATGEGRYADPWHPFAATSQRLTAVLEDAGFTVDVDADLDRAMTRLDGVDLLVVNAGDPWRGEGDPPAAESVAGLGAALRRGVGILGMHAAAATMRDYPEWSEAFGAIWLPGLSWHPPHRRGADYPHPVASGCGPRRLRGVRRTIFGPAAGGQVEIVATHEVDGAVYPAAWTRVVGRARVAGDVLGHDKQSSGQCRTWGVLRALLGGRAARRRWTRACLTIRFGRGFGARC